MKEYNPDYLCDLNKQKIPEVDNVFNTVIAGEVLEHLNCPEDAIKEFYRVLKHGGVLIVSVPNICSLVNRIKVLLGQLPTGCAMPYPYNTPERHQVDFNLKILKEILQRNKFEIEEVVSNGLITKNRLITSLVSASFGETLIVKCRK